MPNEEILVLENLSKAYVKASSIGRLNGSAEYKLAIDSLSFSVKRGETLGILGHNGSGKSTLLRLIAGITSPTSGSITVKGKIASIFELGSLFHPELSGYENIEFAAYLYGLSKEEIVEKREAIVEFSELRDRMHTAVKHYSSGMYLRLAIALIINLNVDIFLLDEVLSVGDLSFQHKCTKAFLRLKEQGKSFVLVSHNMRDITMLADKAMIMKSGRSVYFGEVDKAFYLYTESSMKHIVGYDDNGGDLLSINKIRVLSKQREESFRFMYGEEISVSLDFEVAHTEEKVEILMVLTDSLQYYLFHSYSEAEQDKFLLKPGRYDMQWDLPSGLLHHGVFYVEVILLVNDKMAKRYYNACKIEVAHIRDSILTSVPIPFGKQGTSRIVKHS